MLFIREGVLTLGDDRGGARLAGEEFGPLELADGCDLVVVLREADLRERAETVEFSDDSDEGVNLSAVRKEHLEDLKSEFAELDLQLFFLLVVLLNERV